MILEKILRKALWQPLRKGKVSFVEDKSKRIRG